MAEKIMWVRHSAYCVKSSCGRFSVTKVGPDFARSYVAWHITDTKNGFAPARMLDVYRDGTEAEMAEAAKTRCQHAANAIELEQQNAEYGHDNATAQ